jgi:hypothetical protein
VLVTHDPGEAVLMGASWEIRMVLGEAPVCGPFVFSK